MVVDYFTSLFNHLCRTYYTHEIFFSIFCNYLCHTDMLAHMLYHFLTWYVCFLRSIFRLFFSTLFSRLHFARSLSGNSSLSTFYFVLRISQIIRFTLPRVLRVIFFHILRLPSQLFHFTLRTLHYSFSTCCYFHYISHFPLHLPLAQFLPPTSAYFFILLPTYVCYMSHSFYIRIFTFLSNQICLSVLHKRHRMLYLINQ